MGFDPTDKRYECYPKKAADGCVYGVVILYSFVEVDERASVCITLNRVKVMAGRPGGRQSLAIPRRR